MNVLQALVDGKNFPAALNDFDAALRLTPASEGIDRARLLAGRGLAWEGIGDWVGAIKVGAGYILTREASRLHPVQGNSLTWAQFGWVMSPTFCIDAWAPGICFVKPKQLPVAVHS
jgi:hypothetical protein